MRNENGKVRRFGEKLKEHHGSPKIMKKLGKKKILYEHTKIKLKESMRCFNPHIRGLNIEKYITTNIPLFLPPS